MITFIPGKLYHLKNCGYFVFKCNGKYVVLDERDGDTIMFLKEEKMQGVEGSNLFFLHQDYMIETNSRISNNGRDTQEISQYLEEVV